MFWYSYTLKYMHILNYVRLLVKLKYPVIRGFVLGAGKLGMARVSEDFEQNTQNRALYQRK